MLVFRCYFQLTNVTQASQRLSPEPEGTNREQIVKLRNFGSRKPLAKQLEVVPLDAHAIVDDFDELHAAAEEGDIDLSGLGIDGVLDEFLDGWVEKRVPL